MWLLSLLFCHNPVVAPVEVSQILNHGIIWAVTQDETGFLWFGTSSGLFRYDGRGLKSYKRDPTTPGALSDNLIRDIFIDSDSRLWVGTADGLNLMAPDGTFKTWRRDPDNPASLGDNYINVIVEGPGGRLWVGTRRGLNLFDPVSGTAVRYHTSAGLSGNRVLALVTDQRGALWIGSEGGLDRWDPKEDQIHPWSGVGAGTRQEVTAVIQDRDARIWVAGVAGISCIDLQSGLESAYLSVAGSGTAEIESLVEGEDQYLWAGAHDGALIRIDRQTGAYRIFRDQRGDTQVKRKDIVSMYIDQSRVLWMGTFLSGLYKADLKPPKFQPLPIRDEHGAPLVEIQAAAVDQQDRLWLGSQRGLFRYNRKTQAMRHYKARPDHPTGLSENQILSLLADGDHLWVGTFTGGLNRLDMNTHQFKRFHFKDGGGLLSRNVVHRLFKDRDGVLWAGTRDGLVRLDNAADALVHVPLPDGRRDLAGLNMVLDIEQDHQGLLWIGADGYGLCRLDPSTNNYKWFRYNHLDANSLAGNRVNAILETAQHKLWIGTHTGLSLWDPQTQSFQNYGVETGLDMDIVLSLAAGPDGELWVGTNDGLLRFDPSIQGAHGLRRFDTSDGLNGNNFFRGVALDPGNGQLLFGGTDGLNTFDPKHMNFNTVEPAIVLTSFKVLNRNTPVGPNSPLELGHDQNHFSCEFAALDFTAPHKNRYAWKLVGFDHDWIDGGSRTFANYTNLPPGAYTLRIKGSNNDGVWNEEGLSLPITIRPPFWRTLSFRLGLAGAVFLILLTLHRRGVREARQRNTQLENLVQEKTENLENAKRKLLDLAHQSGIFEITHGVLEQIFDQMVAVKTRVDHLADALNDEPRAQLETAVHNIQNAPTPQHITQLFQAESRLTLGQDSLCSLTEDLLQHINLMRDTVTMQHEYTKMDLYTQEISICTLVDNAVLLSANQIRQMEVLVQKRYLARPKCKLAKVKMLHVLVMVIQNSLEAMAQTHPRCLILEVATPTQDWIQIRVIDTGVGLDPTQKEQCFSYGYTTKPDHSGFGLHDCANAMHSVGGSIDLAPGLDGVGAMVTLQIPLTT